MFEQVWNVWAGPCDSIDEMLEQVPAPTKCLSRYIPAPTHDFRVWQCLLSSKGCDFAEEIVD